MQLQRVEANDKQSKLANDECMSNIKESKFLLSQRNRLLQNQEKNKKRQEDRNITDDPKESSSTFWSNFDDVTQNVVQNGLSSLKKKHDSGCFITSAQRHAGCSELDTLLSKMHDVLRAGSDYLLPADLRRASDIASTLTCEINGVRNSICPQEKFSFRKYREHLLLAASDVLDTQMYMKDDDATRKTKPTDEQFKTKDIPLDFAYGKDEEGFRQKKKCLLKRDRRMFKEKDYSMETNFYLDELEDCTISLYERYGSVKIQNLKSCTVYCGPVSGSVHIDNCNNCTIYVACRQLRIHNSENITFFVHVISGPIIEDCTKMIFSGLYCDTMRGKYSNLLGMESDKVKTVNSTISSNNEYALDYDMKMCNLIPTTDHVCSSKIQHDSSNMYHDVKDFKWHNVLQHSPNWSILSTDIIDKPKRILEEPLDETDKANKGFSVTDEVTSESDDEL